jgi:hypothetical protein
VPPAPLKAGASIPAPEGAPAETQRGLGFGGRAPVSAALADGIGDLDLEIDASLDRLDRLELEPSSAPAPRPIRSAPPPLGVSPFAAERATRTSEGTLTSESFRPEPVAIPAAPPATAPPVPDPPETDDNARTGEIPEELASGELLAMDDEPTGVGVRVPIGDLDAALADDGEGDIVIADDLAEIIDDASSPHALVDGDDTQRGKIPPMKEH